MREFKNLWQLQVSKKTFLTLNLICGSTRNHFWGHTLSPDYKSAQARPQIDWKRPHQLHKTRRYLQLRPLCAPPGLCRTTVGDEHPCYIHVSFIRPYFYFIPLFAFFESWVLHTIMISLHGYLLDICKFLPLPPY